MNKSTATALVPLKYVAEITSGSTPKSDSTNWGGDIPFITPPDLNGLNGSTISRWERTLTELGTYRSTRAKAAVLLSCRAPIGHVGIAMEEVTFNQGCKAITPKCSDDLAYLAHCLVSYRAALQAQGRGTTFIELSTTELSNFAIPWPSPSVRRSISNYLNRETGELGLMIAKLDDLMDVLTARRHAKIASVLASMSVRIRLTLVVDIISGSGFPDRFQGVSGQELPFYKVSSLSSANKGYLYEAENSVTSEMATELGARILPPGSVIMAKIGAALLLARYAVTSRPACIDNNLQALVPRGKLIDSRFLAYAMEEVSIPSLVKPGPVPSLDVMGMKMTDIAYDHSLEEQHRIVDHLDEVTSKIDAMIAKVSELKSLLIERRAALITDVVTGRKKVA